MGIEGGVDGLGFSGGDFFLALNAVGVGCEGFLEDLAGDVDTARVRRRGSWESEGDLLENAEGVV